MELKRKIIKAKELYYLKNLFLIKYLFSLIISLLAISSTKNFGYTIISLIELSLIFFLSNFFIKRFQVITQIFNSVLLLLYNTQILVLNFGTSYVTLTMVDNISSWEALGGRAFIYGFAILLLLFFSFLPINKIELLDTSKFKRANLQDIILIFTEGFSHHIIDDSRNITPTIKEYESKSISFRNYYNHTFATYRGIEGQLFSGYQIENNSRNYLISLPKFLSGQGYKTEFINNEPKNKEFTDYLSDLGFDNIYS